MRNKLCYILPQYDDYMDEHYFHIIRLLEEIGLYVDVSLIIEKAKGIPKIKNVREVYTQKYGYSSKLFRIIEIVYLTLKMRLNGYKKFFIRTSQTAAIPICLVTRFVGGEVYLWRSGQGKDMIPRWSFSKAVIREKIFSELTFKLAVKLVDHFVTGPESMAEYFISEWKVDPKRIVILYNDIDLVRFSCDRSLSAVCSLRQKLDLPLDKKIVLMVHRFSPVRRTLKYLPKVILDTSGKAEDVRFLLIGDGQEKLPLETQINNKGLQKYVRMMGSMPNKDIQKYYAAADVFIMPSYVEGFPRVLLEAMASGLPFISTDAGGVPDLVAEEQRRFVVPKDDVDAFSHRLLALLDDAELRMRLGKANREHVNKYSVENVARMYVNKIFPINVFPLVVYAGKYVDQLVKLDDRYIKDMGNSYSHVIWRNEHFKKKLDGKEEYSRVALTGDEEVIGFWISSLTNKETLHTHRVAVAEKYRELGVAKRMFEDIKDKAVENGITGMTVGVSMSNTEAIRFYYALDFHLLKNEKLISFLKIKSRSAKPYEDHIEEIGGLKYYIFFKGFEQSL